MLVWGLDWEVDYALVGNPAVTVNVYNGTMGNVPLSQWQQSCSRSFVIHGHHISLSLIPTHTTKHPPLFKNSAHFVFSFGHQTFVGLDREAWSTNLVEVV